MKTLVLCLAAAALSAGCEPAPVVGSDAKPYESDLGTFNPDATDPFVAERAACAFHRGDLPVQTLPITAPQIANLPIKTVVVIMKENRSFDHILGGLRDHGRTDVDAIPAGSFNNDLDGKRVDSYHIMNTCIAHDADHQWDSLHKAVNGGAMDSFVKAAAMSTGTDGHFVMSHYDDTDIPFYYWLANTFSISDRHFPSELSGTFPNRNFLVLGTAGGVPSTGGGFPPMNTPTIFDEMDKAGVTWGVYTNGSWLEGTLNWDEVHVGCHKFPEFAAAADAGTLPNVVFVDSIAYVEDEHPTADVQLGEAWTRNVYSHLVNSKQWPNMAIFYTYDEGGGFYDHVPPPKGCVARPVEADKNYNELGVRVPLTVISPYARPHYVSHTVTDHTAITRFIETVWNLPALTARDANSSALLDLFDFSAPALLAPPVAPAAGTGGCLNTPVLTTQKPQFGVGEDIVVCWKNGRGIDPTDWISVYPYPASGPTPPQMGSKLLEWSYIGGGQTPSTNAKDGCVTLNAKTIGSTWPLGPTADNPFGLFIAYYQLMKGTPKESWSIASVPFNVK